ncbi:PHP domain-containing protein [Candidatus Woesebacteria bacterium]|nr:PHP domain-containing protein [Candidatus Woesebacteria bacterium]
MPSDQFSNKSIAKLLRNIASAYTLVGDPSSPTATSGRGPTSPSASTGQAPVSRFKIIAYQKAADSIEHLSREIHDMWQEGKLYKIPGIGPGIGSGLEEYFEKGESEHFNAVLKGIPPSVFTLMDVPGIGPKKAFRLVMQFGITEKETVIQDLKKIAKSGQIATLEGFGEKSEKDIIEALDVYERNDRREERMPLPYAFEVAEEVRLHLAKLPEVSRIDFMGSLRRRVATIGDIDIAVAAQDEDAKKIIEHFLEYPGRRSVEAAGQNKASILAAGNIRIDLRVQNPESYGSMLQYFTGSKAHNIKLREHALKKGYSLSEYGLKRVKSLELGVKCQRLDERNNSQDDIIQFKDEESLYEFLGMQYVPPELREDTGELELAVQKKLPTLIEHSDIKGDFHMHSSYDIHTSHDVGLNTYEELIQKATSLNYSYIGFADHNPRQKGLSTEDTISIMKERKQYIDQQLSSSKIPYFIGLEVDILPSGEIALPVKAIEYVDYLIVSVHSSFKMNMKDMTDRVLKALSYPKVKIFGHPTGRLLGSRDGIDLNWDRIFSHVIENNIALEINAGPSRLDLPDTLVKEGNELGATFIVNTDAHAAAHLDWMKYGIFVVRRGWLTSQQVVNTWDPTALRKWMLQ